MSACATRDCTREARGAIRTTRPQRENVYTRVWWDDRAKAVPKSAERLCKQHMLQTLAQIGDVLLDLDEEVTV